MKQYEIQINKIVPSDKDVLKSMEIEVTDKELLKLTNGIIQGMSGSPILQNGKLIGAVTHVFVNGMLFLWKQCSMRWKIRAKGNGSCF